MLCWFSIIQINHSILSKFAIEFANKCGKFMQIVWAHTISHWITHSHGNGKLFDILCVCGIRTRANHNVPWDAYHTVTSHTIILIGKAEYYVPRSRYGQTPFEIQSFVISYAFTCWWRFKCGKMFAMFMEQNGTMHTLQSVHFAIVVIAMVHHSIISQHNACIPRGRLKCSINTHCSFLPLPPSPALLFFCTFTFLFVCFFSMSHMNYLKKSIRFRKRFKFLDSIQSMNNLWAHTVGCELRLRSKDSTVPPLDIGLILAYLVKDQNSAVLFHYIVVIILLELHGCYDLKFQSIHS